MCCVPGLLHASASLSWPQGVHVMILSPAAQPLFGGTKMERFVRVASLWRPSEAWLWCGWPVSQLTPPSIPPSRIFLPSCSSWNCDSYFSSPLIQHVTGQQLAQQRASFWQRCRVAGTTTSDDGTIFWRECWCVVGSFTTGLYVVCVCVRIFLNCVM